MILFVGFNIDIIVDSKFRKDNEKSITVYKFKRQNCKSSRVSVTSSTCLGHITTSSHVQAETTPTTFSDHFIVIIDVPLLTNETKHQPFFRKTRDLRGIKGDKTFNFLLL